MFGLAVSGNWYLDERSRRQRIVAGVCDGKVGSGFYIAGATAHPFRLFLCSAAGWQDSSSGGSHKGVNINATNNFGVTPSNHSAMGRAGLLPLHATMGRTWFSLYMPIVFVLIHN
jgi:hypothetical protein